MQDHVEMDERKRLRRRERLQMKAAQGEGYGVRGCGNAVVQVTHPGNALSEVGLNSRLLSAPAPPGSPLQSSSSVLASVSLTTEKNTSYYSDAQQMDGPRAKPRLAWGAEPPVYQNYAASLLQSCPVFMRRSDNEDTSFWSRLAEHIQRQILDIFFLTFGNKDGDTKPGSISMDLLRFSSCSRETLHAVATLAFERSSGRFPRRPRSGKRATPRPRGGARRARRS